MTLQRESGQSKSLVSFALAQNRKRKGGGGGKGGSKSKTEKPK